MAVGQVPGDGVRAGVQADLGQFLAQLDDQFDGVLGDRGGAGVGAPGAGHECGLALGAVAGEEFIDPGA